MADQTQVPGTEYFTDADDVVVISKEELEGLRESERLLNALQAAGVDNWSGYSDALGMLDGDVL